MANSYFTKPPWLDQSLEWQDDLDLALEETLRARLKEYDIQGIGERFCATNPSSDAVKQFGIFLLKLVQAIQANLPRKLELEALQELRCFVGEPVPQGAPGKPDPQGAAPEPVK